MAVVKFLRNFFAIIFAFIFGILLLLLIFIIFAKGIINETNIDKYINSSDIFESNEEIFQTSDNNTIKEEISNDLFELGISREVTNDILKSDGLDQIISKYVCDYIKYILFYRQMPILSSNQIIEAIDSEGVKLKRGEITPEESKIIDNYITDTVLKVNNQMPTNQDIANMGYDVELIKITSCIIFSKEIIAVIIMCLVLMILLIRLCCYSARNAIRTASTSILLTGIIIVVISMIEVKFMNMLINGDGIVEGMILKITNETFKDLFVYGISLIVIGIILLIIIAIFVKKPKKEKNIFNESIKVKRSQVQKNLKDHIALSDEDIDKIDNTIVNKEIEKVELPLEQKNEKEEKVAVKKEELPKVEITADFVKEEAEDVKPILLEEKEDVVINEIVNNESKDEPKIVENEIKKSEKEDIEVVEVPEEKTREEVFKSEEVSYFEIDEEKEEEFVKKEIDIKPLENIDIKVTSPIKGKEIEVDLEKSEEKEEDIELL